MMIMATLCVDSCLAKCAHNQFGFGQKDNNNFGNKINKAQFFLHIFTNLNFVQFLPPPNPRKRSGDDPFFEDPWWRVCVL